MPKKTANGKYTYSKIYYDKTLHEWITEIHKFLSALYLWKYYPLKPGAFGYDNLAHSISWVFLKYNGSESLEIIADYVHRGWAINYLYWRDNKPWVTNTEYIKPGNVLGDERRNKCAETRFKYLCDEEKKKDLDISSYLINSLKKIKK